MAELFKPPFWVRLADPGSSFYDPLTKLKIIGSEMKEVKALTPMTEQWIRGGGLIRVENPAPAAPPSPPQSGEGLKTSTQINEEDESTTSEGDDEDETPSDLDALLKGDDEDDEEPAVATPSGKKETAKASKSNKK